LGTSGTFFCGAAKKKFAIIHMMWIGMWAHHPAFAGLGFGKSPEIVNCVLLQDRNNALMLWLRPQTKTKVVCTFLSDI
jgi:hypothetical protein